MSPLVSPRVRPRTRVFAWLVGLVAAAGVAIYALRQPQQSMLLLGLIAAALIIALKDPLLAILGWYILKGRKGIRVGDLVEIDGTQGEVIEFTILRTTLLETGGWATAGYPTGRQAVFMNNFLFHHKYFNFTTAEQWMWDHITIAVPVGKEITPETLTRIQRLVETKTRDDIAHAEEAWARLSRMHCLAEFGVTPPVVLRSTPSGLELIVRYIVRAQNRFASSIHLRDEILSIIAAVREPHAAPFVSSFAALDPHASIEEDPYLTYEQ